MTREEIERLRQLQSAATPGERHRVNDRDGAPYPEIDRGMGLVFKTFSTDPQGMLPAIIVLDEFQGFDHPLADAEFVQAMTPDMVGRLLDAAEAHLTEQTRIDAAVANGRREGIETAVDYVVRWEPEKLGPPGMYARDDLADAFATGATDAVISIEEGLRALLSPTPTTEEGA